MSIHPLFREAKRADADEISDLYLASRKLFLPFAPIAHTDDQVRQWIADHLIPKTDVTVAVREEQILGFMALARDETTGWIDQLYLRPNSTNLGIGTQFVRQAKDTLGSPIRLYTFQENEGARRFYERHCFKAIKFTDGAGNEEKCPDILYEWRK